MTTQTLSVDSIATETGSLPTGISACNTGKLGSLSENIARELFGVLTASSRSPSGETTSGRDWGLSKFAKPRANCSVGPALGEATTASGGPFAATAATLVLSERTVETHVQNILAKLGAACSAACRPIDDKRGTVEFRTKVAAVLAKRAARIAYKRAGGK